MQIPPSGTYPQTTRTPANAASRAAGKSPDGAAAPAAGAGSYTPTSDLASLLSAVRDTPEVRPDVVQSAAARLAAGEFNTPQAAGDTARALYDAAKTGE